MDQDSFRTLLKSGTSASSGSAPRPPLLNTGRNPKKGPEAPSDKDQPAFKPRKVNKTVPSGYRDRAAERRHGVNEYADVEAVLENFEKNAANAQDKDAIEEQRRYLGGDEKHTVLVKGLDFALLEQRKAQGSGSKAEDDELEAAFAESTTTSDTAVPKKRTRDDLLQELKSKRDQSPNDLPAVEDPNPIPAAPSGEADKLEKAKQLGKFKPIGASSSGSKRKDEKRKKKKRKVENVEPSGKTGPGSEVVVANPSADAAKPTSPDHAMSDLQHTPPPPPPPPQKQDRHPPEPDVDEDIDIFANVGEYEGVDLGGDDSDDDDMTGQHPAPKVEAAGGERSEEASKKPKVNWFNELVPEEPDPMAPPSATTDPLPRSTPGPSQVNPDAVEEEEDTPMRLAPLASSSIQDIKSFIEMDKELEKAEKRRARKDKNKNKKS